MIEQFRRFGLLAAVALPLAGCATAPEGPDGFAGPPPPPPPAFAPAPAAYDGILPALPADAGPGECYAKVVAPGRPIAGPPPREGWIRVLCDADATPERIGRIQHSLHERGYYHGGYSGRYDRETADAVTRFQAGAHIAHGGYLSLETVQALETPYTGASAYAAASAHAGAGAYASAQAQAGAGGYATGSGYPPAYAPPPIVPYGFQSGYRSGYAPGPSYSYGPPQPYAAGGYAYPAPAYPCCVAVGGASYGYDSYGYSNRGFGGNNSPVLQNGWLVWSGKTTF